MVGPFEHARTLLNYGRRLRETGRAGDAVQHLTGALNEFTQLGTEPWLAQTLSELKACDAVPAKMMIDEQGGLGERKLQLALALARGEAPEDSPDHLLLTVPRARHLWSSHLQSR